MTNKQLKTIGRADAKGREPMVEIPPNEKWLLMNKKALDQVKQGLADSAAGRVESRGSFIKDDDTE